MVSKFSLIVAKNLDLNETLCFLEIVLRLPGKDFSDFLLDSWKLR